MTLNEEQKQEISGASASPLPQFCALAHRAQDSSGVTPIFLIVFRAASGGLRFLVDPSWHSVVNVQDAEYIECLLHDFLERAKEQPTALFEQLSSLSVGPLVTQETGEQISDHAALAELSSRFVPL
jgi:hypothetical protein